MYEVERDILIADLGLENVRFEWEIYHKKRLGRSGRMSWVGEAVRILPGFWRIRVASNTTYQDAVDSIAHELRHVKQWEEGWITEGPPVWTWTGTLSVPAMTYTKQLPYKQRPTELDAVAYAAEVWSRLFAGKDRATAPTPTSFLADILSEGTTAADLQPPPGSSRDVALPDLRTLFLDALNEGETE